MKDMKSIASFFSITVLTGMLAISMSTAASAQIRPPLGNAGGDLNGFPSSPPVGGGGGLLGGGAPTSSDQDLINKTEQDLNAQAQGQFPVITRSATMPIGAIQKKWNAPISSSGQTAPGIMRYVWRPDFVMPVRTREFMTTTIELPSWENVDRIILGDTMVFEAVRVKPNILVVRPSHSGADTNMTVIGVSGNIYNFYVRSEGWNSTQITDFTVYITANNPIQNKNDALTSLANDANNASAAPFDPTAVMNPAPAAAPGTPVAPDYIRKIAFDPANLRFDLKIYAPTPDDIEIAPLRVFTDGVWTYFDYGELADSVRRPVIYRVVDGVDSMVNTRTVGPKGNIMIAEATGNFTLRNGTRVVCVYSSGAPRTFGGSRSMPTEVPDNDPSLFYSKQRVGQADPGLPTQVETTTQIEPRAAGENFAGQQYTRSNQWFGQ